MSSRRTLSISTRLRCGSSAVSPLFTCAYQRHLSSQHKPLVKLASKVLQKLHHALEQPAGDYSNTVPEVPIILNNSECEV